MTAARVLTTNVLECLRQVLAEHHQHQADVRSGLATAPLLLAIMVDERERLHSLLDEAVRADDGLVVNAAFASDTTEHGSDPAEIAALASAVERALAEINALPGSDEHLELGVDRQSIKITGVTDLAAASRGQQALRGLLASLFAVDLRANDLAGLVYADDALDADHKAIVWRLLMRLPELLRRRAASTLVIVAGDAELRLGIHCTGETSLRWRVSDGGLQTRHARARDQDAVDALTRFDAADAPLIMLMLGAGASAGYLPLGNEVRNYALEKYIGYNVDGHNYPEAADEFYRRLARTPDRLLPGERAAGHVTFRERLTLERVLREEQHEEHRPFSRTLRWFNALHKQVVAHVEAERDAGRLATDPLVRLLARRRRLILVTVNFDQIIEVKAPGDIRPFVTAEDFASLPGYLDEYTDSGGRVPLIKAHGDIDVPDTIVADITTTSSGLARPVLEALTHVRERLLAQSVSPLWHVGYSMRDVDLEDFWSDPGFAERATERWVSPMPDPAVERFIEQKRVPRWALAPDPQQAEESIVTLTATDFFALLENGAARRWS